MTGPTPGPWQVAFLPREEVKPYVRAILSPLPEREIIARVYGDSPADARLIAAAPALLAAARHALITLERLAQEAASWEELPDRVDLYDYTAAKQLRAALALAEGDQR